MNLLILKWQQWKRILKLIPVPYYFIIAILIICFGSMLLNSLWQGNYLFLVVYAGVLFIRHQQRKDKRFIQSLYQKAYIIYLIEYAVISSPFLLLMLVSGNFKFLPVAIICLILIACWPQRLRIGRKKRSCHRMFSHSYEWISGCRKSFLFIAVFYLVTVLLLFKTPIGLLVYIFVLLACCDYYREGESLALLCLPEQKPLTYISKKIKEACLHFHILSFPVCLLFLILYASLWWIILLFSFSTSLALAFCICVKYARDVPDEQNVGNQIILLTGIFCAIIPVFIPVTLILGIRYLFLAETNLKTYLNAYD